MQRLDFAADVADLRGVGIDEGDLEVGVEGLQRKCGASARADQQDVLGLLRSNERRLDLRVFSNDCELEGVEYHLDRSNNPSILCCQNL